MKKEKVRRVFVDCLRRYRGALILLCLTVLINFLIFRLYGLPREPFYYTLVITVVSGLFFVLTVFARSLYRANSRERLLSAKEIYPEELPAPHSLGEADYQNIIRRLIADIDALKRTYAEEKKDTGDYYAAWVHQIKTPIAVMRMLLAEVQTENKNELENELFRIEQYVEMVLQYIRLGDDASDLVIREYELDDLIRQSVRKYASGFVGKRLKLDYQPITYKLVTDRKWFACILEQLLSNAIKYTPSGSVRIALDEEKNLWITDTGIGIAPEDLPRIFEKGYTGTNGRLESHSSGLGLYLCKKAADRLSIGLRTESTPGKGSSFILNLKQE